MSAALKFHPLADIFPLMEGAEFDELVADIKANGQHARIVLKDGMILDGRNRYRACRKLGIEPSFACEAYSDQIIDPTAYVISANIRRRHLTAEKKRELLIELVKASPEKSDRTLAKEAGTTHPTIAKARKQAEATGKALPVEKRTGADGKARKRPAKMPKVQSGTPPKRDIVKEAFDLVLRMDAGQRAKFFDLYLERYGDQKYRGKFTEAWREEESKAAPQPKRGRRPETKHPFRHLETGQVVWRLRGRAGFVPIDEDEAGPPPVAVPIESAVENASFTPVSETECGIGIVVDDADLQKNLEAFRPDVAPPKRGEDNAPPPDVGAEIMKAKMAALDDGIPEVLRREPKAAAS